MKKMQAVVTIDPGSVHTGWAMWREGRYSISGCWHRQQSRSKTKKLPGFHSQLTLFFTDFFGQRDCDLLVIERPYPGPNCRNLLDAYNTIITLYKETEIQISTHGDTIEYLRDPDEMVYDVSPRGWTSKYPKEKEARLKKAEEIACKQGIVSEDEACAVMIGDWYFNKRGVKK